METLEQTIDRVLIEGLPESLRDRIRNALARGASKRQILARARRVAGRRGATTLAAIAAFLDSLPAGGVARE